MVDVIQLQMVNKHSFSRYERHLDVPEIGHAGQQKIFDSSVLVVGLGGLGCPAALYLAAAGIGKLGLIDADTVSLTNLQRQILYAEADIGQLKTERAADRLLSTASECEIVKYPFFITEDNAQEVISTYDIVLDCTDNFNTRYLLNRACFLEKKPIVSASVYHHEGQISVFCPSKYAEGPCYQCLYSRTEHLDVLPQCKEGGILGAVAGILGTMQAAATINEILNIGETLSGWMLVVNTLGFEVNKIKIFKRENCEICGKENNNITSQPRISCKVK